MRAYPLLDVLTPSPTKGYHGFQRGTVREVTFLVESKKMRFSDSIIKEGE